jgi:sporulation protein YlmC with PRC-barrel domain
MLVYTGDATELRSMTVDDALLDADGVVIGSQAATGTGAGTEEPAEATSTPGATSAGAGTSGTATPAAGGAAVATATPAAGSGTDTGAGAKATPGASDISAAQYDGLIRVSRFNDYDLRNADDADLGEVEDLVVNLNAGRVMFAVVDFGGFLGLGETSVAVPWSRLQINPDAGANESVFTLNADEDTLSNAPQVNLDEWPEWPAQQDDMGWETETEGFWQTVD